MQENLQRIKELFNKEKLTLVDAEFYANKGYSIICGDGQVIEIKLPFNQLIKEIRGSYNG